MNFSFPVPQNPYFVEYVAFPGFFLPHEVDRIIALWEEGEARKAEVSGSEKYREDLRQSRIVALESNEDHQWIYQRLQDLAIKTNRERFFFDLIGFAEALQLTEYGENDFFDWHLDFGAGDISTRKLSLTVQLSDPAEYEGGELEFRINDRVEAAPGMRGTVIVFPSFIMHRVKPVTRGTRRSIVGWAHGVPYR